MEPAPIEKLLEAFKVLDIDNKGYVTKDFMAKVMSEECEPFSQEELEEMFSAAVDGSSNKIPYEYYLNQLMVDIWIFLNFLLLHNAVFENKKFLQRRLASSHQFITSELESRRSKNK